jgi:CRP-like cAMP-binding protein
VVPNNEVARHAVLNYSEPAAPHSRVVLLRLSYETPPDRVLEILRAAAAQVEGLPAHPPAAVRILAYEESAVCYEVRYHFARYEDYRRAEGEILRLAWYHLRRASVEIPVAVRNVHLHQRAATADEADPLSRLVAALRHVDLVQPRTDDQLHRAAARFRTLRYAEGERVIEEGAPGDSFFLVDRGTVKVLKVTGGRSREMARLGPGDFFGEMALLTGEQRSATVVALDDVELFVIDKGGFHDILLDNPEVAVEISSLLAARRHALTLAAGEVTAPLPADAAEGDLKDRLLARIRAYFGL